MDINIGDVFIGGSEKKCTVIKINNTKGVILFLFEGSGQPFVVTNSFEVDGNYIRWQGSRYRENIDSALEVFNELTDR